MRIYDPSKLLYWHIGDAILRADIASVHIYMWFTLRIAFVDIKPQGKSERHSEG